jgi:hypothetical protein
MKSVMEGQLKELDVRGFFEYNIWRVCIKAGALSLLQLREYIHSNPKKYTIRLHLYVTNINQNEYY